MKYTVVPALNDEDFGEKAADVFLKAVKGFQAPPSAILPTGHTPLPFYDGLVERAKTVEADRDVFQVEDDLV